MHGHDDDGTALQTAAKKIQGMYRVRMARRRLRQLLKAVVERFYDEDSGSDMVLVDGMYYYYNAKTGESSWFKPTLLGSEDANLAAMYHTTPESTSVDPIASPQQGNNSRMRTFQLTQRHQTDQSLEVDKAESPETQATVVSIEQPVNELATQPDSRIETPQLPSSHVDEAERPQPNDTPEPFSPEELALIHEQFHKFDKDGSGCITADEMMAIMHAFGDTSTLETIQALIHQVDGDGNGEVSVDEFVAILKMQRDKESHCPSLQLAIMFGPDEILNLKRQFQQLDTDNSGEIDDHELATLIKSLGQEVTPTQLKEIIDEVDRNKNGTIDFNEFCHIVYNMRNPKQSRFATLLHLGVAKGLLKDLGSVMNATGARVSAWWNADKIAEEQRLKAKRERALERERLLREQYVNMELLVAHVVTNRREEREKQIFQEELARLAAVEKARVLWIRYEFPDPFESNLATESNHESTLLANPFLSGFDSLLQKGQTNQAKFGNV
ncbi:hypothetical protein AaE_009746 [Aphanomyces astaci]|uniref:Uncharacterized protein n=1 Tax=Aphanomyces astaci TaxID=112090 RepID=A0A6A5A450_APHAT|nr:hypothetical protein AaE_009746 [Aphanomyces astaci]